MGIAQRNTDNMKNSIFQRYPVYLSEVLCETINSVYLFCHVQ